MRTGIYVYRLTTVTISPLEAGDAGVELLRYSREGALRASVAPGPALTASGAHELEPGIYQVVSQGPILVEGRYAHAEIVATGDKDRWPDPPSAVLALEPDATAESVGAFFTGRGA